MKHQIAKVIIDIGIVSLGIGIPVYYHSSQDKPKRTC